VPLLESLGVASPPRRAGASADNSKITEPHRNEMPLLESLGVASPQRKAADEEQGVGIPNQADSSFLPDRMYGSVRSRPATSSKRSVPTRNEMSLLESLGFAVQADVAPLSDLGDPASRPPQPASPHLLETTLFNVPPRKRTKPHRNEVPLLESLGVASPPRRALADEAGDSSSNRPDLISESPIRSQPAPSRAVQSKIAEPHRNEMPLLESLGMVSSSTRASVIEGPLEMSLRPRAKTSVAITVATLFDESVSSKVRKDGIFAYIAESTTLLIAGGLCAGSDSGHCILTQRCKCRCDRVVFEELGEQAAKLLEGEDKPLVVDL
jgi:hypothetical protein